MGPACREAVVGGGVGGEPLLKESELLPCCCCCCCCCWVGAGNCQELVPGKEWDEEETAVESGPTS